MKLFNFLKKIINNSGKTEAIKEKITFSEIGNLIDKKSNEIKIRENEANSLIQEKINNFISELKEKINIAKNVDIESKKAGDKINFAVNEGRKKYIEFLEKFMEDLENIEKSNLEKVIEDINLAFLHFNKSSKMSYERATILIGKEMGNIKDVIRKFSKEMIAFFDENKDIILTSKRISLIKSKLSQTKETGEIVSKVNLEINSLSKKILDKEEESREISEKIRKIRESPEYLKDIEQEKIIQISEKEVEKEISELRQIIDFKTLTNFFHIFEGQMELVKSYKENFLAEFKKDRGKALLNLLNESKLNNEKISDKIKQINDKEEKIISDRNEIKNDETQILSSELEKVNLETKSLISEKERAEKRNEKLKISQDEIFKVIKEELKLMNAELVED